MHFSGARNITRNFGSWWPGSRAPLLCERFSWSTDTQAKLFETTSTMTLFAWEGRKDGLKPITLDLLDHLKSSGLDDTAVFDRLRIVAVDLDEGSDGLLDLRLDSESAD